MTRRTDPTVPRPRRAGAYLRDQGVYSSQITQWRRLRDAGLLAGKEPGENIGQPITEQAEVAQLTRELEISRPRLAIP